MVAFRGRAIVLSNALFGSVIARIVCAAVQ